MKFNVTRAIFWIGYALVLEVVLGLGVAHAATLEIGLGQSRAHTTNSVWYEDGLPHQLSITPPAYMLGVTGDWTPSVAWHADFVDLGRMSVDSWDVPNDRAQYDWQHGGCNGKCPNLVHVIGSGQVLGMAFTAEPHMDFDGAQIGVEAGPFVYLSQWSLQVPNWQQATGVSGNVGWSGTSSLTYSNTLRPVIGGVVGLSISRGRLGLSLRHYFVRKTPGNFPAVWTSITRNTGACHA